MISVMNCAVLDGFGASKVRVEVDISRGLPSFCIVGLAENSVKESRVRVQSAIANAGFDFPRGRISVNLAPADIQKRGTAFDLTIALAILEASGLIPAPKLAKVAALGELSLTGEIRPVRGMLALAESIREQGFSYLLVSRENGAEASLIKGLKVKIISTFNELVKSILAEEVDKLSSPEAVNEESSEEPYLDMSDVCGQEEAKRALLIAAAGDHNLVLIGGPGSGKSMMAMRLPTILPPLNYEEALTLTKIHSLAGLTIDGKFLRKKPFRAPHHSCTRAGLAGGGASIRPGEISLACYGVLFLDELLEFPRPVLEILRQPLESGEITICRANQSITYPAQISFVAALNPCPCGNLGQSKKSCACSPLAVSKYQSKLSGPLADRIDLHVNVWPLDLRLMAGDKQSETSTSMRERVIKARAIQAKRFGQAKTNGKMGRNEIKTLAKVNANAFKFLIDSADALHMSARSFDRIIKIARTIADLEDENEVEKHHIGEALCYRPAPGFLKK